MSKAIPPNFPSVTSRRHLLISILVVLHFAIISLSYATNWRRSAIQDQVIVALQPYLIGANFYQEMLPVEWVTESFKPGSLRFKVEYANKLGHWEDVLRTDRTLSSSKLDRLLHVLAELIAGEDSQGVTRLLNSIVLHLESGRPNNAALISKVSIERAMGFAADGSVVEGLYEASLARFPNGEFGFIPKIESNRSVQALDATRVKP